MKKSAVFIISALAAASAFAETYYFMQCATPTASESGMNPNYANYKMDWYTSNGKDASYANTVPGENDTAIFTDYAFEFVSEGKNSRGADYMTLDDGTSYVSTLINSAHNGGADKTWANLIINYTKDSSSWRSGPVSEFSLTAADNLTGPTNYLIIKDTFTAKGNVNITIKGAANGTRKVGEETKTTYNTRGLFSAAKIAQNMDSGGVLKFGDYTKEVRIGVDENAGVYTANGKTSVIAAGNAMVADIKNYNADDGKMSVYLGNMENAGTFVAADYANFVKGNHSKAQIEKLVFATGSTFTNTGTAELQVDSAVIESGATFALKSGSFFFGNDNAQVLDIYGAYMQTGGTTRFNGKGAIVNVYGTLNALGGVLNVNSYSTLNIKNGATAMFKAFSVNDGSTVSIESGANTSFASDLWVASKATLNLEASTTVAKALIIYGTANVESGAVMSLGAGFTDVNSVVAKTSAATINVRGRVSLDNGQAKLYNGKGSTVNIEGGTLAFNGGTLVLGGSTEATPVDSSLIFTSGKLAFDCTVLNDSDAAITVMEDGALLGTILASDFSFSDIIEDETYLLISFVDSEKYNESLKNLIGKTFNYNGYEALFGGSENDFTVTFSVPEPSAWAAILGALALAFAACRRRK